MKADGFERMDVATDIHHDVKFRRLARLHPELVATAGWVYVALLGDSWREGERLTLEEAWPPGVAFDPAVVDAMAEVELIDDGRITERAWEGWYVAAHDRRGKGRERQRRADAKRGRGSSPAPSSPSSDRQAGRPAGRQAGPSSDRRGSNAGRVEASIDGATTCEECQGPVIYADGRFEVFHRDGCSEKVA